MNRKKIENLSLFITLLSAIMVFSFYRNTYAQCESSLKLEGSISISCCADEDCISAAEAVYEYTENTDDDPTIYSIAIQSSPWHLYDGEMRILALEELAQLIKPELTEPIKSVLLVGSWTGIAPEINGKSIAQKLSQLLDGFPVTGMNGFIWLDKDGNVRTTKQAFTMKPNCPYRIHQGDEVMVSLVAGWPVEFEQLYFDNNDGEGLLLSGAGWDIYMLCPENALNRYETAAKLGNPIAAYNAALMYIENNQKDNLEMAISYLEKAVALGDRKAQLKLQEIQ